MWSGALKDQGIIPARAGFTGSIRKERGPGPDHPRSRGVYPSSKALRVSSTGSSPLARGLRSRPSCSADSRRIIPARAGFTRHLSGLPHILYGSSPLARGLLQPVIQSVEGEGSSPLARGLPLLPVQGNTQIRIIPARAGFTTNITGDDFDMTDHPRSRGVYPFCRSKAVLSSWIIPARAGFTCGALHYVISVQGSSPLARGLPSRPRQQAAIRRIIPARAGFTTRHSSPSWRSPDHPRSRGVYFPDVTTIIFDEGSSPLARGLPENETEAAMLLRIIPARAGFTASTPTTPSRTKDHPRSRGVYRVRTCPTRRSRGSSPLARGLPQRLEYRTSRPRIIPARAGFTRDRIEHGDGGTDHPRSRGVYSGRGMRLPMT